MRRFLTSSPVPGPSSQSQAQEEKTISRSSLSDASIISDPADPLEDTRSLSRASSMSTSRLDTLASSSVDMVSASGEETSDHEKTQGGGQTLNAEELKGSLHGLNEFFKFYKLESSQKSRKFKDKILHKGMASCCKCPQKIKFDSESRGNLKKHYKTKHPSMLSSLEAALSLNRFKPTTKIEKTSRQITLKEATERPKAWSQELAQQAYVVWFAEGLKSLCNTEDEATRTFLNLLKPEFKMPCRKTLTKRLNKYAAQDTDHCGDQPGFELSSPWPEQPSTLREEPHSLPQERARKRLRRDCSASKSDEVLCLIAQRLSATRPEDELDAYGKVVVGKLRKLPSVIRMCAEKLINDVLYEGERGALTHNTKLVNIVDSVLPN